MKLQLWNNNLSGKQFLQKGRHIMKRNLIAKEAIMNFFCRHPSYLVTKEGSKSLVELEEILADFSESVSFKCFREMREYFVLKGWAELFDTFARYRKENEIVCLNAANKLDGLLCSPFFMKIQEQIAQGN